MRSRSRAAAWPYDLSEPITPHGCASLPDAEPPDRTGAGHSRSAPTGKERPEPKPPARQIEKKVWMS